MPLPWSRAHAKVVIIIKKLFHFLDNFFFGFVIPYQIYSHLKFVLDFKDWVEGGGGLFIFTKLKFMTLMKQEQTPMTITNVCLAIYNDKIFH